MSKTLSTLKKLAVCLGCCECTEDNTAKSNAEGIEFICEHIGSIATQGVTSITLKVDATGKLERGVWCDSAGNRHRITINH